MRTKKCIQPESFERKTHQTHQTKNPPIARMQLIHSTYLFFQKAVPHWINVLNVL